MKGFNMQTRASIGAVTGPAALLVAVVAVVISLTSGALAASHAPQRITAKQLAPGAVTGKAIARGAVTAGKIRKSAVIAPKLAKGSVTVPAIAPDAVTAGAIAPGSVGSVALVPESIHTATIADRDAAAENGTWTASDTVAAVCDPSEDILGTGMIFTEPGNHEVSFLRVAPALSPTGNGVSGEISSNSGGTAKAQVMVICLGP
jgi:hypothetical protein